MVILEKGQFRLQTISYVSNNKDGFCDAPVSAGLAIEKIGYDNTSYVICFIKYDKHEGAAGIEDDVHGRLLDIEDTNWQTFKNLYSAAKHLVEVANMEEE